jgi:mRNA interferase MazF
LATLTAGTVVLIPFPFSDLSQTKLRPAVAIAYADKDDWILCQVTSKSYSDSRAVQISNQDFSVGSLALISYVRPGKIFTANLSLVTKNVGVLRKEMLEKVIEEIISLLQAEL